MAGETPARLGRHVIWYEAWPIALCGIAMGFINNLAGGGGLIGLAALEAVAGLPATVANAALRPSALTIGGMGMLGFRSRGLRMSRRAWLYGLLCVPGAVLGSIFLITLPEIVYRTALFAVVGTMLYRQLKRPKKKASEQGVSKTASWVTLLLFTLAGIHMGFIQVAVGLMIMLAISRVHGDDLVEVNAAKMAVLICTGTASVITLASQGAIQWTPAIALALGCGLGSFLASRWAVKKGHAGVRGVVILVCVLMLARLAWQLAAGG